MNQTADNQSSGRSVWLTLLRLALAASLFAVVLLLVPIKDHLSWPSRYGDEELVGRLTWQPGRTEVHFLADDSQVVRLRSDAPEGTAVWTHLWEREQWQLLTKEEQDELKDQPVQGLVTTMRNVSPAPFCAALVLYVMAALLSFSRWYFLLQALSVPAPLKRCVRLGFLGLFFSNIIPGMTGGDLVKAIYVARDHRGQRPEAVLSVLVDRALGLLGLALVASAVLLFSFSQFKLLALGLYALIGCLGLGACLVFSRRLRSKTRLDRLLNLLPAKEVLKKLDRAFLAYRNRWRTVAMALGMSLVVHCMVLTAIGSVGLALDLPVPAFWYYFALAPLPLIIQAIPLAPAGLGVGEAAFVWVFASQAALVSPSEALALALTYRAVQMTVSLSGGLQLLWRSEAPIGKAELNDTNDTPTAEAPLS